jgi:hypothetical protein
MADLKVGDLAFHGEKQLRGRIRELRMSAPMNDAPEGVPLAGVDFGRTIAESGVTTQTLEYVNRSALTLVESGSSR